MNGERVPEQTTQFSVQQELARWDQKSANTIQAIYEEYMTRPDFTITIVNLSKTPNWEVGATWLLKAWLESGHVLDDTLVSQVYKSLSDIEHWEAQLHVLQSIPFMTIKQADADTVYGFLIGGLNHENKFLRAWSYNGLYELSKQHTVYLKEARQCFDRAVRDEAPSVKARIRNIMKKGL